MSEPQAGQAARKLGGGWEIIESSREGGPLPCAGPDVGV